MDPPPLSGRWHTAGQTRAATKGRRAAIVVRWRIRLMDLLMHYLIGRMDQDRRRT